MDIHDMDVEPVVDGVAGDVVDVGVAHDDDVGDDFLPDVEVVAAEDEVGLAAPQDDLAGLDLLNNNELDLVNLGDDFLPEVEDAAAEDEVGLAVPQDDLAGLDLLNNNELDLVNLGDDFLPEVEDVAAEDEGDDFLAEAEDEVAAAEDEEVAAAEDEEAPVAVVPEDIPQSRYGRPLRPNVRHRDFMSIPLILINVSDASWQHKDELLLCL